MYFFICIFIYILQVINLKKKTKYKKHKNSDNAVNPSSEKNKKKTIRKRKNYNLYLYTQIVLTSIIVLSSFILKLKNEDVFFEVKNDYKAFFTVEEPSYSNFSYKKYIDNLLEDLKEKYLQFTTATSLAQSKGSNISDISNVSYYRYIPEEPGVIPLDGIITSEFGIRENPFNKLEKDFHTGIDIAAAKGSFIKAAFGGTVTETGYNKISGNFITIKSDDDFETFYGHIQFILVNKGDKILKNQIIATVGDTGLVTGPHLHFETIYKGNRVNPVYTVK